MKKIYIVVASLVLSAASFSQTADSLLRRQMELERDFNPTITDADKVNSLPALPTPSIQKANTNYSTWAGRTTPPLAIALPRPGNRMTAIPYNQRRGYLSLNAGNYANIDGAFGYRIVEDEKNSLDFSFRHNSSDGDIKYVQKTGPSTGNAYFMDNEGRLGYLHRADALTFDMELSYLHSLFNYYGNRFGNDPLYEDKKQRMGIFNVKMGIASHESELFNYRGTIRLRNFSTRFGALPNAEGIQGNEVRATVGLDKPFGATQSKVGIDGEIFTTFYDGDLDNYFLINAAPYITFGNKGTNARLGADVLFQNSGSSKVRVVPHVKLQWAMTEFSSLYADIHGGFGNNTFLEMMQESRYVSPYGEVKPSYSIVDMVVGAKIGEVSGFRFDIFGGFKKTDDAHFLILNGQDTEEGGAPGPYREVLRPVFGDLSHTHIGGIIQCRFWPPLDISLRVKKNFYNLDYIDLDDSRIADPKAYNMPGFEADIRAAVELTGKLKLTADYYFAGDRWSYFNGENLEMDQINDLNAGALYKITDAFSVNARANNLFVRKYDLWYGYPAQGFNVSGGFTFRF